MGEARRKAAARAATGITNTHTNTHTHTRTTKPKPHTLDELLTLSEKETLGTILTILNSESVAREALAPGAEEKLEALRKVIGSACAVIFQDENYGYWSRKLASIMGMDPNTIPMVG